MARLTSYQDLDAWDDSLDLVDAVYRVTKKLPRDERFGLTAQLRRAATSVCANIAEGAGRRGSREFARFVAIARGSCYEVEAFLHVAVRLGFLTSHDTEAVHALLKRLILRLTALGRSLLSTRRA